jgi:predicted nucleotidyltransferase component of viral defense system
MSVSLDYLEQCSTESGFGVAGLEKVVRLGAMAGEIGRHPLLSKALALKGGTALNLAFGPPERLSVDLDFNYVGALERERMLEERPRVEGALDELAQRAGYRVQRSAEAFAGRKLFLHYRSVLGPEERIEVDVNYLMRQPLGEPCVAELWQPGELDRPRLTIVGDEELVIGKLCALLDRCAARDVWDVANLRARTAAALDLPNFRRRFLALAGTLDHPPDTYTERRLAERTTQREVDEQLVPMLAAGAEVRAPDLVAAAWSRLAPLLALTEAERGFVEKLHRGDLDPSLLFPDDVEEAARIRAHPAVRWKAQNARSHHDRP